MPDYFANSGHPFRRQMQQVQRGRAIWITLPALAAFVVLMGLALTWFVYLPVSG